MKMLNNFPFKRGFQCSIQFPQLFPTVVNMQKPENIVTEQCNKIYVGKSNNTHLSH